MPMQHDDAMVQDDDGMFHVQMKWCIWCIHHDTKMTMLLFYAPMRCMKHDAYTHEFMMHTLQHVPYDRSLARD